MKAFLTAIFVFFATFVQAVEPDEVLTDPVLEQRARAISEGLRCLQCRNESIDESNAVIARDLRILVRARLVAGDSDTEVVDYVVARYGEYVLLKPNGLGINLVLWLAGPLMFIIGAGGIALTRRRKQPITPNQLTAEEEAALKALLNDRE